jgi:hypothetical protein
MTPSSRPAAPADRASGSGPQLQSGAGASAPQVSIRLHVAPTHDLCPGGAFVHSTLLHPLPPRHWMQSEGVVAPGPMITLLQP